MISVVIPAYNEEHTISKCLDSLNKQKTSEKFEIIVVDNASTDRTAEVLKNYKSQVPLKIIYEPKKKRGQARYTGFKNAIGELIFSTDADAIVPEDWLEKMTRYFKDPRIVAVTSIARINDRSPFTNWLFNFLQPVFMILYRITAGYYWLNGFSFGIRRDIYFRAGEFDPRLNTAEDVDLSTRVKKLGKIKFTLGVPVVFSGRRFRNGIMKGLKEYAVGYLVYLFGQKDKADLSDPR